MYSAAPSDFFLLNPPFLYYMNLYINFFFFVCFFFTSLSFPIYFICQLLHFLETEQYYHHYTTIITSQYYLLEKEKRKKMSDSEDYDDDFATRTFGENNAPPIIEYHKVVDTSFWQPRDEDEELRLTGVSFFVLFFNLFFIFTHITVCTNSLILLLKKCLEGKLKERLIHAKLPPANIKANL